MCIIMEQHYSQFTNALAENAEEALANGGTISVLAMCMGILLATADAVRNIAVDTFTNQSTILDKAGITGLELYGGGLAVTVLSVGMIDAVQHVRNQRDTANTLNTAP